MLSYKEKDRLVPTYITNVMNKFLHDLAEIKEKYLAQLEEQRHYSTQNVGNHTAATYGTTEEVAAKLKTIINSLLEKARDTPIDVGPNQPHMKVEEALKTMKTLLTIRMESKISFDFLSMTYPKMLERQQIITPQMSTP